MPVGLNGTHNGIALYRKKEDWVTICLYANL